MAVRDHREGEDPAGGGIASPGRASPTPHPARHGEQPVRRRTAGDEDDRAYWLRREREARALAARAVDEAVARIHLALAERYAARAIDLRPPRDRGGAA